ncbi:conserved hypothetical protein [Hyphomicrobiales bacterium]|nr:conserved hypothetical protein [Hyphomicrobiales bacterium]CAH1668274.1 conserved hypothetical protein [Hyphomicrobiales bacterium]
MNPGLSTAQMKEALAAYAAHGNNMVEAARSLGLPRGTLANRIRRARDLVSNNPDMTDKPPEVVRREVHDAAFWRKRWNETSKDLAKAERLVAEMGGIAGRPVEPVGWLAPSREKTGRAAGLIHISDLHLGEVVDPDEILGLNAYDIGIAKRRLQRLFDAAIEILPRWSSDCQMAGVVVALNGDLISGDIHDELRRTNALTSQEQVWMASDLLAAGLVRLADEFGSVFVAVTPGNHGRTTHKPEAKQVTKLSYDMMIGECLRRHFEGDGRVTVHLATGRDAVYPIFAWTVFQSHGDAIGTKGGMGFAGPMLPIVRGTKLVELQGARASRQYDVILTGHYHTSGNPGRTLANGSVVGYAEYPNGLRCALEPPQQWLALMTERWGLRERCEIKLEDPVPPPLPRVRVPAAMARSA